MTHVVLARPTFCTPRGFCNAIVRTSIPGTYSEMSIWIIGISNESVVVNLLVQQIVGVVCLITTGSQAMYEI